MFTVTKDAARQIRESARSGNMDELALRISAQREADGSIGYKMGFDEINAEDVLLNTGGVDVLITVPDKELLNGTVLDYVEVEAGQYNFVFLNPNDPHYVPPAQ